MRIWKFNEIYQFWFYTIHVYTYSLLPLQMHAHEIFPEKKYIQKPLKKLPFGRALPDASVFQYPDYTMH